MKTISMLLKTSSKFCFLSCSILALVIGFSCQTNFKPYTAEQLSQVQRNFSPKFVSNSPDILYGNDASGYLELWQLSKSKQLQQISNLKQEISNLQIAQDGSFAIFAVDSGGNERYDMYKYEISNGEINRLTKTSKVSETAYRISPKGTEIAFEADPETPFRPQIFIYDIKSNTRQQITKGDMPVYHPIWSNNGKKIAAYSSGDFQYGELLIVNLNNLKIDTVKPPSNDNVLKPITFSPDDKYVLCVTENEQGFDQLTLVDIITHELQSIGSGQWDVLQALWNKNSGLFYTQNISGRTGIYHMQEPQSEVKEVLAPSGYISGLNINEEGTMILFSKQDGIHPREICLLDLKTNEVQQLTNSLPIDIEPARLSKAEPFKIQSFDSTIIEGFLYKPAGNSKKLLPSIIQVHGGPTAQDVDAFDAMTQLLTQAGFVVFKINYRGSSGYGKAFEDLNNKDWGGGDRKDIRAVVEYYIKQGLIDKNKIGITGGSYGGYMTYIALTKDSDFYAAGAAAYGMVDLILDYNLCKDRWGLWYEGEMGNPIKDSILFADRSPINFISQIKAPLIVFQGANDSNVPKWSSDLVVDALKSMQKPVDYVVYPDEGHGFTRRVNKNDNMQRTVDFFKYHLQDDKTIIKK
jgi:dipeptidyl aminopeptidase/acylaminoacyl peptidase